MNTRNFQRDTQIEFGTRLFGEETTWNIQNIMIPGIDMDSPETYTRGSKALIQGDSIEYQELSLTFIIDEEMKVWKELMNYLFENVNTTESTFMLNPADSWITIRDSKGSDILTITYTNSHITNIGSLSYDSTGEDAELVLDVSIRYDYFKFI